MHSKRIALWCMSLLLAGYAGFLFHQHYGLFTGHADTVVGRVERVYVKDARFGEAARMDTGAGLSSINAEIITIKKPEKDGDPERVVFRIPNEKAKIQTLERDIIGWQNIKKKGDTGYTKRPVVMLKLCIAGKYVEAPVNLADRSSYVYSILIGRDVLKSANFMVDPAQLYTHHAMCR